jgi:O-antigen ligase
VELGLTAGGGAVLAPREVRVERVRARWSRLAYGAVLAFAALLYSSPMYWWPSFERWRLNALAMAVAALATVAHRLVSGERLRLGGAPAFLLFGYLAFVPLSWLWTLDPPATWRAVVDATKLAVVYVAILNALDRPSRLRVFLLVAALAALGPALGGIWNWWNGEGLVEGFRTRWRGLYADPNRLAMSLVAVLPFAVYGALTCRRLAARMGFWAVAAANGAAIVLTHSRSGAVAAGVAVLLAVGRGRGAAARRVVATAGLAVALVAFAPSTFWTRSASIANFGEDASVQGRENAWKVLGVIVEERPLHGVGAGAFLASWARYAPLEAGGHRFVAHNVLLEIVGDLGIPAFLLFVAFVTWLLARTFRAGADPLVGPEARAVFAGLAGYLVCEMANGYSLSWFLYLLFGAAAASVRLATISRALGEEARS